MNFNNQNIPMALLHLSGISLILLSSFYLWYKNHPRVKTIENEYDKAYDIDQKINAAKKNGDSDFEKAKKNITNANPQATYLDTNIQNAMKYIGKADSSNKELDSLINLNEQNYARIDSLIRTAPYPIRMMWKE